MQLLQDENVWINYSVISLWEIEIKHIRHPMEFGFSAADIEADARMAGFHMLGLEPRHISALGSLMDIKDHKDPFDRMLIAQAKADNMVLLTRDSRLPLYRESCVLCIK
jgi:PIN domain nuclease of toxin-antitoxin system